MSNGYNQYLRPNSLIGTEYRNFSTTPVNKSRVTTITELEIYKTILNQQQLHTKRWTDASADVSFMNSVFAGVQRQLGETPIQESQFSCQQIKKKVDAITGYEIDNRKQPHIISESEESQKAVDQQNTVQGAIRQSCFAKKVLSEAFKNACSSGMAVIEPIGYDTGVNSFTPKLKVWKTWDFVFDLNGQNEDGSDWEYFASVQYISRQKAHFSFPWVDKSVIDQASYSTDNMGVFSYSPNISTDDHIQMCQIIRLWTREPTEVSYFVDAETGRKIPAQREDLLDETTDWIFQSERVYGWVLYEFVNGNLVNQTVSPFGDTTPFIPVFWEYSPESPVPDQRYVSLIRQLKAPNYIADLLLNNMMDAFLGRPNGGIIFYVNSVDQKVISSLKNVSDIPLKDPNAPPPTFIPMSVIPQENLIALQQLRIMCEQAAPVEFAEPDLNKNDSGEKLALMQSIQIRGLTPYMMSFEDCIARFGLLMCKASAIYLPADIAERILGEPLDPYFWSVGNCIHQFTTMPVNESDYQKKNRYYSIMNMFKEWGRSPSTQVMKEICFIPDKEKIFQLLEEEDKGNAEMNLKRTHLEEQAVQAEIELKKATSIQNIYRTKEIEARAMDIQGLSQEHNARTQQAIAASVKSFADALKTTAETQQLIGESDLNRLLQDTEKLYKGIDNNMPSLSTEHLGSEAIPTVEEETYGTQKRNE